MQSFGSGMLPFHCCSDEYVQMIETLLISLGLVGAAMLMLGVKVLLRKNGEFASMHIHDSKAMKERGIDCVLEQDRAERAKKNKVREKSETSNINKK